ncbi:MAG: hypothetical protein K5751_04645 [Treponemataceae bacterium]|nr:hypothetical protein [Treponemataceae bacterium]
MNLENVYFFNGTAYAGKSTMVHLLAEKYNGIECGENYHDALLPELDKAEFPCLTYTRDLEDWHDFIRRSPEEYERWINGVTKECEILELRILNDLIKKSPVDKKIFVDTNICPETLHKISDEHHVMIMLAAPEISVNRFFERPDKEKQFLYKLMLEEKDPQAALENFRHCLERINSVDNYKAFETCGFPVNYRDEKLGIQGTLELVEKALNL